MGVFALAMIGLLYDTLAMESQTTLTRKGKPMKTSKQVTITGTSYNGCRGEVVRVYEGQGTDGGELVLVYMPPQKTNRGEIRRGTSWHFQTCQLTK